MKYLKKDQEERLEKKIAKLNDLRPFPVSAVSKLRDQLQIEMTYNSNGIEGNSLTLKETYLVVAEGLTVKGKSMKDHLEAKDHTEALEYLSELVESGKRNTMSEQSIRALHALVVKNTETEYAGRYRDINVMIGGTDHTPPDASVVPAHMRELLQWIQKNKKLHPVELAAVLHHKLVHIHPFVDGNGRTARLVMNVALMQKGYPLVVILKNDRKKYYRVLGLADSGDYAPLVQFIVQAVERSLDMYLNMLNPVASEREVMLTLAELAKESPYDAKYLNLLARTGKLEAHKQGRRWMASREAVDRYMERRERKRDV
jgi:Fic family protein